MYDIAVSLTNEELVRLIQAGERDRITELWQRVEKFVAWKARRLKILGGAGGVEVEDLIQSGYIALVSAADTYNSDTNSSFVGWLALRLKSAFAEAGGYRSPKQARDPLHYADSLDAPVNDDRDTLVDFVADSAAEQALLAVEEQIYNEQLHMALEKAMSRLPAQQGTVLRRRFYLRETLKEVSAAEGISAPTIRQRQKEGLRALLYAPELRQFLEQSTHFG